jgi:hypothetical protein
MAEWLDAERDAGQDRDPGEHRHEPEPPGSPFRKVAPS